VTRIPQAHPIAVRRRLLPCRPTFVIIIFIALAVGAPRPATAEWDTFARLGTGTEKLQWSIASQDGSPNVLSELSFRSATTVVGVLGMRYRTPSWSLGGEISYGGLTGGTVQDDDFARDNRQGLFSRSLSAIDGHYVFGLRASFDSALYRTEQGEIWLTSGARYHEQRFRMRNGNQIVPPTGTFRGSLNSMFDARWYGTEIGLNTKARILDTPLWAHAVGTWLPFVVYDAKGWWNLRPDFQQDPSFTQRAFGWGWSLDLGLSYKMSEQIELGSGWRTLQFMATRSGTDTTYFSDGTVASTGLNEANASSSLFYLEFTRHW
jgi:hypothetical protein